MPMPVRLVRSAVVIATLTLGSRLLGLARECIFSYYFGTSGVLSAFRIAFMVPNLARRLFGEGALSAAMIPVLTDCVAKRGDEAARRLAGTILTLLIVALCLAAGAAELVLAVWRRTSADLSLELCAILIPYMVLICAVAVAGGILHVRQRFAAPAAVPILLNLGIIAATLGGATLAGLGGAALIRVVCYGVLAAGVAQLVVIAVALKRAAFFPVLGGDWRNHEIRSIVAMMAPMVLGLSAVQLNTLADYLIAYWFIVGDGERLGPAVLGYASFLYQLPLGVFGIALATAIFPLLSTKAAQEDRRGVADVLVRGLRLSMFIALPSSVGLIFVARPLVATLHQRGDFTADDTTRVAGTLVCYAVGLVAYFAQHLVVRTFYALKNSRTPARVAAAMVAVNLGMNLALVGPLQERGLALATAICAALQIGWLAHELRRTLPEIAWRGLVTSTLRSAAATTAMAGVLALLVSTHVLGSLAEGYHAVRLAVLVVGGALAYGVAARALRIEELKMILPPKNQAPTTTDD